MTEFPNDFYPTDMQWNPRPNHISIAKKLSLDVLLITTADGTLFILKYIILFNLIILFYNLYTGYPRRKGHYSRK